MGFETADTNDPERLARGITTYAWAPGIFRGGHRKKVNFMFADWLGLDFESPEFSLAEAVRLFCDMTHVIGTTRNHQVLKDGVVLDRFRVLIRLEHRCESRRDLEATMRAIAKKYPIDKSCVDAARHFFACKDIVSVLDDGYLQEVLVARRTPEAVVQARRLAYRAANCMPALTRTNLTTVIPIGARNTTFYGVAKDLMRMGYDPDNTLQLIIDSATYGGSVPEDLRTELADVIESGRKSLQEECADDRRASDWRGEGAESSGRTGEAGQGS